MTKLPGWKGQKGARPLSEFLAELVEPALARQGLGETSLVTDWSEIAGEKIARKCRPIEVQWPPRPARRNPDAPTPPATLVLRVDGAFALEIQHSAALIVERVNAHLGWRCIGKLAFRQGPLGEAAPARPRAVAPSPAAQEAARRYGAPIEGQELREALTRLGARVIDRAGGRRPGNE